MKDAPNTINFYQQLKALQGDYKSLSEKKETFASDIVALKDEMDNEYIADTPEKKEQYRKDIEAKTKELEEVTAKLDANIDAQYDVVARMQEIVLKAYGHDKGFKKYNVAKKADEEITVPIKCRILNLDILVHPFIMTKMRMQIMKIQWILTHFIQNLRPTQAVQTR